jgi:hypothetical protein
VYYQPTSHGREAEVAERLADLARRKAEALGRGPVDGEQP